MFQKYHNRNGKMRKFKKKEIHNSQKSFYAHKRHTHTKKTQDKQQASKFRNISSTHSAPWFIKNVLHLD